MKIQINNCKFKVKFIDGESKKLNPSKNQQFLGLTEFCEGTISIRKGMDENITRQTVIHELTHAFIFAFGYTIKGEEPICDFFGSHGDAIINLANEIMKKGWK